MTQLLSSVEYVRKIYLDPSSVVPGHHVECWTGCGQVRGSSPPKNEIGKNESWRIYLRLEAIHTIELILERGASQMAGVPIIPEFL